MNKDSAFMCDLCNCKEVSTFSLAIHFLSLTRMYQRKLGGWDNQKGVKKQKYNHPKSFYPNVVLIF